MATVSNSLLIARVKQLEEALQRIRDKCDSHEGDSCAYVVGFVGEVARDALREPGSRS
jgi:hypothetical protein